MDTKSFSQSEPAHPSLTAAYNNSCSALGISLSADGNTAFVADDGSGLQITHVGTTALTSTTYNESSGMLTATGTNLSAKELLSMILRSLN